MFQTEGTQTTQMWTSCFLHQGSYMWGKYQEPGYGSKLNPTRSEKWSVMIVLSSLSRVNSGPSVWSICRFFRVSHFYGQIIYLVPVWGLFSCQALGRPAFHPYAQHTPTRTCSYLIIPCVKPGGENPGGVTQSPWRSEYMYRFASWSESQWARTPAHQAAGLVWGRMFWKIWCLHHNFNFFSQICSLTEFLVCNGLYMFIPPLSPLHTIIVYPHIIWIHAGGLIITEVVRQILLQTFEELLSLLRRRRVRCTQRAS